MGEIDFHTCVPSVVACGIITLHMWLNRDSISSAACIFKTWIQSTLLNCKTRDLTLLEVRMDELRVMYVKGTCLVLSHLLGFGTCCWMLVDWIAPSPQHLLPTHLTFHSAWLFIAYSICAGISRDWIPLPRGVSDVWVKSLTCVVTLAHLCVVDPTFFAYAGPRRALFRICTSVCLLDIPRSCALNFMLSCLACIKFSGHFDSWRPEGEPGLNLTALNMAMELFVFASAVLASICTYQLNEACLRAQL